MNGKQKNEAMGWTMVRCLLCFRIGCTAHALANDIRISAIGENHANSYSTLYTPVIGDKTSLWRAHVIARFINSAL